MTEAHALLVALVVVGAAGYALFKYGASSNQNQTLEKEIEKIKEVHGEMERQDSIVAGNSDIGRMSQKLSDALREDSLS
jgi:hypothetical protein